MKYFFVCFPKGVVEFGPEVTGKDQKTKMLLNDQDRVINNLIYYTFNSLSLF